MAEPNILFWLGSGDWGLQTAYKRIQNGPNGRAEIVLIEQPQTNKRPLENSY